MAEASAVILDGFRLRYDAKIVGWPERYMDDRSREFWGRVMALIPAESGFSEICRPMNQVQSDLRKTIRRGMASVR
jgi:hypothetical protein